MRRSGGGARAGPAGDGRAAGRGDDRRRRRGGRRHGGRAGDRARDGRRRGPRRRGRGLGRVRRRPAHDGVAARRRGRRHGRGRRVARAADRGRGAARGRLAARHARAGGHPLARRPRDRARRRRRGRDRRGRADGGDRGHARRRLPALQGRRGAAPGDRAGARAGRAAGPAPRAAAAAARGPRRRRGLVAAGGVALAGSGALDEPAPAVEACNGHVELCDRRLDDVTLPATHNAMSVPLRGWFSSLQERPIGEQLEDGIRGLLLDTHYADRLAQRPDADRSSRARGRWGRRSSRTRSARTASPRPSGCATGPGSAARASAACTSATRSASSARHRWPPVLEDIRDFLVTHPGEVAGGDQPGLRDARRTSPAQWTAPASPITRSRRRARGRGRRCGS